MLLAGCAEVSEPSAPAQAAPLDDAQPEPKPEVSAPEDETEEEVDTPRPAAPENVFMLPVSTRTQDWRDLAFLTATLPRAT